MKSAPALSALATSLYMLTHSCVHAVVRAFRRPEIMVPVNIGLCALLIALMVRSFKPHVDDIFAVYKANPPQDGSRAVDPAPFSKFYDNYKQRCNLNTMAALALVL